MNSQIMVTKEQQRKANSIARKEGYLRATEVIVKPGSSGRVVSHVPYGYRKKSNGEYVTLAYRKSFGWKNTFYQCAETVVEIDG